MKFWHKVLSIVLLLGLIVTYQIRVKAEETCGDRDYDCWEREIVALRNQMELSIKATTPLESEVAKLSKQLSGIQLQIKTAVIKVEELSDSIDVREKDIGERYLVFKERVRKYHKFIQTDSELWRFIRNLLSAESIDHFFLNMEYGRQVTNEDKNYIVAVTTDIIRLEEDKKKVETDRARLAGLQKKLDTQKAFFDKEIASAKKYQAELSGKIAELTAKQQAILDQKFGSIKVPLLAATSLGGCVSDIDIDPGFSGTRFAFFSLGVPNRVGLNQYGAKGRAEQGQGHEEILRAYYDFSSLERVDTSITIRVNGTNPYGQTFNNESMNLEEYLKHLYEMPTGWDSKALKAQAIAARSYVLARTNNGQSSIPPSEEGQVVKKEENTDAWKSAVRETEGIVMKKDGTIVNAWYSSTHGGFVLTASERGWSNSPWTKHNIDATSASSLGDLRSTAYDRESPWFYCDWGSRKEYNKTAWLKESEVVDIVNAFTLWQKDHNKIVNLSQVDGGVPDTWSAERVREELGGEAISSISNISVDWNGSGISQTINVNGRSFPAQQFKNMFNVRAPGNIQLRPACRVDSNLSCGTFALFNVERR